MLIFIGSKPVRIQMFRKYLIVPILLLTLNHPAHATVTLTDSLLLQAGRAEGLDRTRLLNQAAEIQGDYHPELSLKYSQMALETAGDLGSLRDRARALQNIGAALVSLGDIDRAIPFLDEAFRIYIRKWKEEASIRDVCRVARILMLKGRPDSSIVYYQQALVNAGTGDLAGIAGCQTGLGETYWKMGLFNQSLEYYTRAVGTLEGTGITSGLDRLYYRIALNHQGLGRYDEALLNLYKSLELSGPINNLTQMGYTYQAAGSVFIELEDFEKAMEYYRKGLVIQEQLGEMSGVAGALEKLADIHMEMEQYDQALRKYNRSFDLRRRAGNNRMVVNSQLKLGKYYARRQNYPLAMSYYRDARELAEELQDKWSLARISINLGELHGDRKEYAKAIQYFEDALSIVEGMESKEIQRDASYNLYEMHKSRGDYRLALECYLEFDAIREAILDVESRTRIANLEARFDLLNKEREIEHLERENMAGQLNLQQEKSLRNYLISLAVFLLLLGSIIALALIRNRQKNAMLSLKNNELEQLNERLTSYSEELDGLNRTKNRLISIISHDLKNPFHSLIGFSDLLVREADRFSEEEKGSFYKSINDTSKKAFELLQNLLDWTRLQTSEIPFNPADLQVSPTIESVIELLNSHARDKGIVMQCDVPSGTVVYADSRMFETVLRNLLSNAVKYTPYGGRINITSEDQEKVIQFAVEDTGVGMDKEQVAHLFDVDKKASRPGTNNELGTGFGLILCREFVKKNDGELSVESEPGKGSTFRFTVPKRRRE